jgi:TRAP transporter 4TM/12TM fusion protein
MSAVKQLTTESQEMDVKKSGKRRKLSGNLKKLITVLAVVMSVYHLYTAAFGLLMPIQQRSIHLAFVLTLIFLLYPATAKSDHTKPTLFDWLLVILSIAATANISARFYDLAASGGRYIPSDIYFGILLAVLVIEAARRTMGNILPIMAVIFVIYAFLGRYVPGPLMHSGFSYKRIIQHLYLTTEGIFGQILGVSSTYIFMFILFGAFLTATGMGEFFNDFAMSLAGNKKGGPAKVSVLSSAFMGTINGSTSANVVTTGSFTIPLMKRMGYSATFAGAVEASASAGGQIMPPVMGAAAFIIADTLGMPYVELLAAAFIPAVLYFAGIWTAVDLRASKLGLQGLPKDQLPSLLKVIKTQGHLVIPILAIIYMLVKGYNALYAAFWGIVLSVIVSFFKKETRLNLKTLVEALEKGALSAVPVAAACAIIGIVIGITSLTGAALSMGSAVLKLSGGYLLTTLLLTMVVAIIMGMGLPSTAAYVLTSAVAAPALIKIGVLPLAAHLFVFYFGILSTITPPVAVGAYAAAGIAGTNPNETGWTAVKLAIAGFIVPFCFVYSPGLLILPGNPWWSVLYNATTAMIGVISLGACVEGYLYQKIKPYERALLFVGAFSLIYSGLKTDILGICLVGLIYVKQVAMVKRLKKTEKEEMTV